MGYTPVVWFSNISSVGNLSAASLCYRPHYFCKSVSKWVKVWWQSTPPNTQKKYNLSGNNNHSPLWMPDSECDSRSVLSPYTTELWSINFPPTAAHSTCFVPYRHPIWGEGTCTSLQRYMLFAGSGHLARVHRQTFCRTCVAIDLFFVMQSIVTYNTRNYIVQGNLNSAWGKIFWKHYPVI